MQATENACVQCVTVQDGGCPIRNRMQLQAYTQNMYIIYIVVFYLSVFLQRDDGLLLKREELSVLEEFRNDAPVRDGKCQGNEAGIGTQQ